MDTTFQNGLTLLAIFILQKLSIYLMRVEIMTLWKLGGLSLRG